MLPRPAATPDIRYLGVGWEWQRRYTLAELPYWAPQLTEPVLIPQGLVEDG